MKLKKNRTGNKCSNTHEHARVHTHIHTHTHVHTRTRKKFKHSHSIPTQPTLFSESSVLKRYGWRRTMNKTHAHSPTLSLSLSLCFVLFLFSSLVQLWILRSAEKYRKEN